MQILTAENVVLYLVENGLCPQQDAQAVTITPLSGKNFNLRVQFPDGADWIVKQEAIIEGQCDEEFLGEWALHTLLQNHSELRALQASIAPIVRYDTDNAILVARFLTGYKDLSDYYAHHRDAVDCTVAQSIGHALGQLHSMTFQRGDYRAALAAVDIGIHTAATAPESLGQVKRLTPETFGRMRTDGFGFYRWVQSQTEVTQALAQLRPQWQGCCVVHQDLKFGNWLWCEARQDIRLIDWEKVDWGDPLTDLADVLVAYVSLWLRSCAWEISSDLSVCLATATVPLSQIQPSMQALIRCYCKAFPAIGQSHPDWMEQTVRWMGRELIDRVLRDIQYYIPLGHQQAATLQLAQRLLCQPQVACNSIFGADFVAELQPMEVAA